MDIRPSLIKEPKSILRLLSRVKRHLGYMPIIRINLSDKLTPKIIGIIKDLNLTFCGIDIFNGSLVIVLAEASKSQLIKVPLVDHKSIEFRNELIENI
jgi:hypothetical protein